MYRNCIAALLVLVAIAALLVARPAPASEPAGVWIERVEAPGDTIRFIARWTPPATGAQHRQITGYEVEWIYTPEGVPLNVGSPSAPEHSWEVPEPPEPVGPLVVRVRARDDAGEVSDWVQTPEWWIEPSFDRPPPPGVPEIERVDPETGAEVISLQIVPDVVAIEVGQTVQLCALVRWDDGAWGVSPADEPICQTRLTEAMSALGA